MKPDIKPLLKKKWYFQGFNGTPALLYGPTRSAVSDMPKTLGYGYKVIIETFEEDKCYFLYAWDDLYAILDELLSRCRKDKDYLRFLLDKDEEVCNEVLTFLKRTDSVDLAKKSNEELYELYPQLDRMYGKILSVSHIIEGFTLTSEDKIRQKADQLAKENSDEVLKILAAPLWPSFLSAEHNELYKIVLEIKKSGLGKMDTASLKKYPSVYKKLEQHQKKYFWKANSYASAKVLKVEDFIEEINGIIRKGIDVEQKIMEFEDIKTHKEKKEKVLKRLNNAELSELIAVHDVMFRLHDHRKEVTTITLTYVDRLLTEIGKRHNVAPELMRYIRPEEISETASMKEELQSRRHKSVFLTLPEGIYVYTGKEAEMYISELSKQRTFQEGHVIKGNCASKGKAIGIVKVCRGEKEISKMKEGEILVACMTQPEFVPAMKKAIAVITDEGGLTCHAAIVSRELGIPCVIGTRIATQVLKDGMKVEVDADKGMVRILEK